MYKPNLVTWRAQYDRMERGYTRLNKSYQSSTDYEDDIQHYFQDCWHLKDWIKNDINLSQAVRSNIEVEVDDHKSLRIVADLANGSKHLSRHTNREGAYVTSGDVTVHLGQSKPTEINYNISLSDGSVLSQKDLVIDAFDAWQIVLKKLNLL
jgi:hypothetical protein